MALEIVRMKQGIQTVERWEGKFAGAKEHVHRLIASGEADQATIYDDIGRMRFHVPRITRRA